MPIGMQLTYPHILKLTKFYETTIIWSASSYREQVT